jgi:hypothetical protein|uniref:Uncharacterized protein ycf33 n=1 Tax=Triparma laevis TaxID=1534972 RepID=A0A0K2RW90_9STRA|nr:conserved hypothetical plastid protein [Triparma laevis]BAS19050.1 conserved hypothetical plastid protein [Triparma laevis]
MNDFWNNILRYPRFFISSVSGLILVILTPFINLIKTPQSRIILLFFIIFLFLTLFFILKNMLAI